MSRKTILMIAGVLWAGLCIYSFYAAMNTPPTGDGFTRGLNRIVLFLTWHGAAIATAIGLCIVGWRLEEKGWRWLSRTPILLHVVATTIFFGVVLYTYQQEQEHQKAAQEQG
ncbi:MAG: hypothetical protein ACFBZ9_11470 [Sphingomonadales bacterium]